MGFFFLKGAHFKLECETGVLLDATVAAERFRFNVGKAGRI